MRNNWIKSAFAVVVLSGLFGCAHEEFTVESMKKWCPPRAMELDMLNILVGTWDMTGEMKPADSDAKPLKMTGAMTFQWDADKRLLVGRMEGKVENEIVMHSLEVWSWDPSHKRFMMTWQDGSGHVGKGYAKWDSTKREFKMAANGKDLNQGMEFAGKGYMRFSDDRTMNMTWNDYDSLGLFKMFESTATAKKR